MALFTPREFYGNYAHFSIIIHGFPFPSNIPHGAVLQQSIGNPEWKISALAIVLNSNRESNSNPVNAAFKNGGLLEILCYKH